MSYQGDESASYSALLHGRGVCANSRWKHACWEKLRVRAEEVYGDSQMLYPTWYVSDGENSSEVTLQVEAMEDDVLLKLLAACKTAIFTFWVVIYG